eukprot:SAG11_NODE_762_length_7297_cov_8.442067_6_plen_294_part_00
MPSARPPARPSAPSRGQLCAKRAPFLLKKERRPARREGHGERRWRQRRRRGGAAGAAQLPGPRPPCVVARLPLCARFLPRALARPAPAEARPARPAAGANQPGGGPRRAKGSSLYLAEARSRPSRNFHRRAEGPVRKVALLIPPPPPSQVSSTKVGARLTRRHRQSESMTVAPATRCRGSRWSTGGGEGLGHRCMGGAAAVHSAHTGSVRSGGSVDVAPNKPTEGSALSAPRPDTRSALSPPAARQRAPTARSRLPHPPTARPRRHRQPCAAATVARHEGCARDTGVLRAVRG